MGDKETSIVSSRAAVYKHNPVSHAWEPADSGLSRVDVYINATTGTYRVIGMDTRSKEFTMNTMLFPTLNYQRASDIFHQWTDSQKDSWGLNFASAEEAEAFSSTVITSVAKLEEAMKRPAPATNPVAARPPAANPTPTPAAVKTEPAPAPNPNPAGPRGFVKAAPPTNPTPVPFSQRKAAEQPPAGRAVGPSVVTRPSGYGAESAAPEEASVPAGYEPPAGVESRPPAAERPVAVAPVNSAVSNELFARLAKRKEGADLAASNPPTPAANPTPTKTMKESNPPTKIQFGQNIDSEPAADFPPTATPASPPPFNKRASVGILKNQVEKKAPIAEVSTPAPTVPSQSSNPQIIAQTSDDSEKSKVIPSVSAVSSALEKAVTREELEQVKREIFAYIDEAKREIISQIVSQLTANPYNG